MTYSLRLYIIIITIIVMAKQEITHYNVTIELHVKLELLKKKVSKELLSKRKEPLATSCENSTIRFMGYLIKIFYLFLDDYF